MTPGRLLYSPVECPASYHPYDSNRQRLATNQECVWDGSQRLRLLRGLGFCGWHHRKPARRRTHLRRFAANREADQPYAARHWRREPIRYL